MPPAFIPNSIKGIASIVWKAYCGAPIFFMENPLGHTLHQQYKGVVTWLYVLIVSKLWKTKIMHFAHIAAKRRLKRHLFVQTAKILCRRVMHFVRVVAKLRQKLPREKLLRQNLPQLKLLRQKLPQSHFAAIVIDLCMNKILPARTAARQSLPQGNGREDYQPISPNQSANPDNLFSDFIS